MKLTVIVLCLLCERFLSHKMVHNRFHWFSVYVERIAARLNSLPALSSPWFIFASIILPILLTAWALLHWADNTLYGVVYLILNLIIFYYCIGPANPFYPAHAKADSEQGADEIAGYLSQANGQLFAPFFWYIALGPLAILTYRLVSLCRTQLLVSPIASWLSDLLDWIPVRMTALLYLLVGNFQSGFQYFSKLFISAPLNNQMLLNRCALDALGAEALGAQALPHAESLVEHATLILLVLLALCTLIAW